MSAHLSLALVSVAVQPLEPAISFQQPTSEPVPTSTPVVVRVEVEAVVHVAPPAGQPTPVAVPIVVEIVPEQAAVDISIQLQNPSGVSPAVVGAVATVLGTLLGGFLVYRSSKTIQALEWEREQRKSWYQPLSDFLDEFAKEVGEARGIVHQTSLAHQLGNMQAQIGVLHQKLQAVGYQQALNVIDDDKMRELVLGVEKQVLLIPHSAGSVESVIGDIESVHADLRTIRRNLSELIGRGEIPAEKSWTENVIQWFANLFNSIRR